MHALNRSLYAWLLLTALLASVVPARGQSAPPEAQPLKLQLESGDDLGPGSVAVAEGVTGGLPVRFVLEGLDVAQPITVVVATTDAARPVKLEVAKDSFADPERSAVTAASGTATLEFRTHGDFGVSVTAAGAGVPFLLAVWAGPPDTPVPPSFLAPVKDYEPATLAALATAKTDAGSSSTAPGSDAAARVESAQGEPDNLRWTVLAAGVFIGGGLLCVAIAIMRRRPQGTHA